MVEDMMASEGEAMEELMKEVPIGRLGQPQEIAEAVLWLYSPGASYNHRPCTGSGWRIHHTLILNVKNRHASV